MDSDREHYINSVNLNIDTDFPYLQRNRALNTPQLVPLIRSDCK